MSDSTKAAMECANKLVSKFPQLEQGVIAPMLRREATIAFSVFIERIAALEQENTKLREALKSIAEGNNDICAYDPTFCPDCSCPSCQARNSLLEA